MALALLEAQRAMARDEVPVGAVIVHQGKVIARGHNQKELLKDPTAHAEMIAITGAAAYLESWRLLDTTVYVTLEPCTMCAGAMVLARIKKLVMPPLTRKRAHAVASIKSSKISGSITGSKWYPGFAKQRLDCSCNRSFRKKEKKNNQDGCPSGLRRQSRKLLSPLGDRGFKSLPIRQKYSIPLDICEFLM